ncbi:MAG: AmpG family muropeptide MFS transporter [Pseudobdellovibrionaceae bacterium]
MADPKPEKKKLNWTDVGRSLTQPKIAVMLALGFSSGLPFMLVGNTLGFWLREGGTTLTTIGFMSWVGMAYSFKFIWAPLVDRVKLPLLGTLFGLRRGWMIFSQLLIVAALFGMSILKPEGGLILFTALAAIAAFASATQDIVIDAWRIESADAGEDMAMMSSAYQLGYRASLLVTDALILIMAASLGWPVSYTIMASLMTIGIAATFFAVEPLQRKVTEAAQTVWNARGIFDAIVGPLIAFFKQYGTSALLILAAVSFYRLADFVMGPMANPFYADLGISKEAVGSVRGSIGLITSLAGITAGGLSALRFGLVRTLLVGALIGPLSNLAFSILALTGPSNEVFAFAMAVDNFSNGFAGTALIGYMSSLTSLGYTATQYALLSSFYTLFGKFLKGFSGSAIDTLSNGRSLMEAYAIFFAGTALIGLPALIFCLLLVKKQNQTAATLN